MWENAIIVAVNISNRFVDSIENNFMQRGESNLLN